MGETVNPQCRVPLPAGTHCAGTVGGATYGVAKKASLVAVKVRRSVALLLGLAVCGCCSCSCTGL